MEALLRGPIKAGRLKVTAPDGRSHVLNGTAEGPVASIRVADKRLLRRMLVMPDLYLGEAYTEGLLTVDEGSLYDVLDFFASNLMYRLHDSAAAALPSWFQNNVVGQSKANVAHHYDLNQKLFELFLDRDLQYSCAYFTSEHQSL
ncbi:MAG TPA: class I SAM-dependent methyltransferase, partial [Hyphomicrobiaceae bacterium]|nr:class I SAM-dependent methyltransferase [Hyphomicrobiaceae bacterium]